MNKPPKLDFETVLRFLLLFVAFMMIYEMK